jgi:UDP-N-acetylglucosamine transferase subunit ALG13
VILVLFGTNRFPFPRLARAVEELASRSAEEIVVQLGFTTYPPRGTQCFNFLPRQELHSLIRRADIVITHGGFATISDCLELGKKIVAVPRKNELGENKDSGRGQEEIVRRLDEDGQLVGVFNLGELPKALEKGRRLNICRRSASDIPRLVLEFVQTVYGEGGKREGGTRP